jgi:signal peptide peptidase SppA
MTRLEEVMSRIGSRPALIHAAAAGDYYRDTAPYEIRDGVAIIDVTGPLSNAAWSWRGTTYGEIQDQVRCALEDTNVSGIVLNVDSPGGETDNAFETAAMIAKAGKQKPVYAVANTAAYSAAYLIASQADKVYCVPTSGGVGSIGVYCAHMDISEALKKDGVKVTLISAGTGKTDGNPYEPLSKTAEANMQSEIDRLYGEFVGSVADGRGMNAATIVKLGARCFAGSSAAIAAGLADKSGDMSVALADMTKKIQSAGASTRFASAETDSTALRR